MQAVNRFLEETCRKIGVPFVDTTPSLESAENYSSLYLFPVDAHGSPKGLELIAKTIADRVMELRIFGGAG